MDLWIRKQTLLKRSVLIRSICLLQKVWQSLITQRLYRGQISAQNSSGLVITTAKLIRHIEKLHPWRNSAVENNQKGYLKLKCVYFSLKIIKYFGNIKKNDTINTCNDYSLQNSTVENININIATTERLFYILKHKNLSLFAY